MIQGLDISGARNTGFDMRAVRRWSRALRCASPHVNLSGLFFRNSSDNGYATFAYCNTNCLKNPLRPRKDFNCVLFLGTGQFATAETLVWSG